MAKQKGKPSPRQKDAPVDEWLLCASRAQIAAKIPFASNPKDSTPKLEFFISALKKYSPPRNKHAWTCAEILDVLMDMGYRNEERNFQICVHQFAVAVAAFREKTRDTLYWRDALDLASLEGWRLS